MLLPLPNPRRRLLPTRQATLPRPPSQLRRFDCLPSAALHSTNTIQSKSSKNAVAQTPTRKAPTTEEMDTLKLKKAWEVAIAPAKQLPMNAFGMYMSGNSLQIFSIMMVFMLFKGPITALINIQNVFARFESEGTRDRLIMVKLAYVACNFLALALGIWKVNGMGLLPCVIYSLLHITFCFANLPSVLLDPTGSPGKLLESRSQEPIPAQCYETSKCLLISLTRITNQELYVLPILCCQYVPYTGL